MENRGFKLTLKSYQQITPSIRHLEFVRSDGQTLEYIPGQFITFHIEAADGKSKPRSYSIATNQPGSQSIEIAISYIENGLASELLFALKPGDEITATGPFGRLILREEDVKRYLLVATGTGVTPYRAMLPQLTQHLAQDPDLQIALFLGVRLPEDLLYGEEFVRFAKQHPRFQFIPCYSRLSEQDTLPTNSLRGYVQQCFETLQPNLSVDNDIIYLCGNPSMIDDAYEYLKTLGFGPRQVRREKYISSS